MIDLIEQRIEAQEKAKYDCKEIRSFQVENEPLLTCTYSCTWEGLTQRYPEYFPGEAWGNWSGECDWPRLIPIFGNECLLPLLRQLQDSERRGRVLVRELMQDCVADHPACDDSTEDRGSMLPRNIKLTHGIFAELYSAMNNPAVFAESLRRWGEMLKGEAAYVRQHFHFFTCLLDGLRTVAGRVQSTGIMPELPIRLRKALASERLDAGMKDVPSDQDEIEHGGARSSTGQNRRPGLGQGNDSEMPSIARGIDPYLSARDLASRNGMNAKQRDTFRKRLDRWRQSHPGDGFHQVTEPTSREPKYLYRESAIRHLISPPSRP